MPGNKLDDYDVVCTIGSGSYGTCKKIKRKTDGKIRVWKELEYGSMTDEEKKLLVSEVNLLRELKHPNIVRYHDRIIDRGSTKIYIVMEFCEGGDLAAYILKYRKQRKFVDEAFIWKALYQLSLALSECHLQSRGGSSVLHRDLKPANVFLDSNNNCKLGDFGLARVLNHDTSFAKTFVGTPYYMSPELVNRTNYNQKSDIWSLGCLIYELTALMPPFLAANQKLLAMKIKDGHYRPIPTHYSKDLETIIKKMLTVVESKRPTIEDILNCQGIRNYLEPPVANDKRTSMPTLDDLDNESLKKKEEQLRKWSLDLEIKEKQLKQKEKDLVERERILDNRLRSDNLYPAHKRLAMPDKENIFNKNEDQRLVEMDWKTGYHRNKDYEMKTDFRPHVGGGGGSGDVYAAEINKHNRALRQLDHNFDVNRYETRLARPFPYGLR